MLNVQRKIKLKLNVENRIYFFRIQTKKATLENLTNSSTMNGNLYYIMNT